MDDMPIIDAVNTFSILASVYTRMGGHVRGPEKGFDPVVIDVNTQALADQPRRGRST